MVAYKYRLHGTTNFLDLYKGLLLQHLPAMLLEMTKLIATTELAQVVVGLMAAIPKMPQLDVDPMKLRCLKKLAKSDFFTGDG